MAKIIPAQEAGLAEGVGRVRVSTSRARRGKILAVEHPIFGWVPYRQWALLRLVPEERILPSIIVGISTFTIAKIIMVTAGEIADAVESALEAAKPKFFADPSTLGTGFPVIDFLVSLFGLPPAGQGFGLLPPPVMEPVMEQMEGGIGDDIKDNPLPFYVATMAAGLTLAGLDPGMALRAFAELLNALIPL